MHHRVLLWVFVRALMLCEGSRVFLIVQGWRKSLLIVSRIVKLLTLLRAAAIRIHGFFSLPLLVQCDVNLE